MEVDINISEEITLPYFYTVDVSSYDVELLTNLDLKNKIGATQCIIDNKLLFTYICIITADVISETVYNLTQMQDIFITAILKTPVNEGKATIVIYLAPIKKLQMRPTSIDNYEKTILLIQDPLDITLHQGLRHVYG